MTRVYASIMLRIVAMHLCKIADTCLSTALDFHKYIALVPLFACGQHRTMVRQALACSLQNKSFARKIHPPTIKKAPLSKCFLVERDGFEPSKSLTTDLQSAPFGHSGTSPYGAGDRNRTNNLLITNQLLCLLSYTSITWCRGAGSNHRHRDFQSLALPTELPRHLPCYSIMVVVAVIFTATTLGDPEGARTPDLQRDRLAY